ncbi:4-alpha-glucanotransferase [soil metagenome]
MRLTRSSGILLHPTSLPGPHGSGDLGEAAYHFVDWLVGAGQKLWQMLPLGGIGPGNSPYMSSSAFAGNVLLIDLSDLQQKGWLTADEMALPDGLLDERIDYGVVVPWRMEMLATAAKRFAAEGDAGSRAEYDLFCLGHQIWLDDYALFMALTDANPGQVWSDWSPGLASRDADAMKRALTSHGTRVDFWKFCQWSFFRQWGALRAYANEKGVKIVGDAPIFIAYQSAEVWANQGLFELDSAGKPTVVAGVPPDYFSATGQRWGNPLYRWSAHAADGYAWWIQRIRQTFEMVDIVRIDHFRGFAAHWEIAADEPTAMNGKWVPGPGDALFEALARAIGPMPIIAEDLGIITPDVEALRRHFAFPGMRILQFAFGEDSRNLYLPHHYQPDTVVYPGTHDNDTTQGWWSSTGEDQRHFARSYLGTDGTDIHWALIRAACASVADTAIYALQDVLGLPTRYRMNHPGYGEGYWEWRFEWSQVEPVHAERLREMTVLYSRDGLMPSSLL